MSKDTDYKRLAKNRKKEVVELRKVVRRVLMSREGLVEILNQVRDDKIKPQDIKDAQLKGAWENG